jgi:hypothetical protein
MFGIALVPLRNVALPLGECSRVNGKSPEQNGRVTFFGDRIAGQSHFEPNSSRVERSACRIDSVHDIDAIAPGELLC